MSALDGLVAGILELPESEISDATGMTTASGWTSLRHVQILAAVAHEYRVRITPREARSCRSVGELRALLAERGCAA